VLTGGRGQEKGTEGLEKEEKEISGRSAGGKEGSGRGPRVCRRSNLEWGSCIHFGGPDPQGEGGGIKGRERRALRKNLKKKKRERP